MEPNFKIPEFFLKLKEIPEFKDAVIAGGYVRDNHLKREFKDVDVFFPVKDKLDLFTKGMKLRALFSDKDVVQKNMEKYVTRSFNGKFDATIDGLEVDFVGNTLPEESFGFSLMETFNYGLDMCFTDGKELFLSKDFEHDVKHGYIRLINLDGGTHNLLHAMEKYNRLKAKYPEFEFSSDYVLERRKGAGWV